MNSDLYLSMLQSVDDKVDALSHDLADIKKLLSTEISSIKMDQASCNNKWSILTKSGSWLFGAISISSIWAFLTGHKQ